MNKYETNFTKLTIADVRSVLSSNVSVADWIALADMVVAGGVLHLPYFEVGEIVNQVMTEFTALVKQHGDNTAVNTEALNDMLDDVDGL